MRMMPQWLLLMLLMLLMLLLTEDLVLPMVNIPRPMADGALRRLSRTSSARGGCSSTREAGSNCATARGGLTAPCS